MIKLTWINVLKQAPDHAPSDDLKERQTFWHNMLTKINWPNLLHQIGIGDLFSAALHKNILLGDAILDATVAEYLYHKFPDKPEGFLSQTRSKIVNGESLAQLTQSLGLDKFIVSHAFHFDTNKNILEDAFEAFIGALYLDQGYRAVRKFVEKRLIAKYIDFDTVLKTDTNYKSRLLEWAQQKKVEVAFETNAVDDDSRTPHFMSEILVDGSKTAEGHGFTKKDAEQDAARIALEVLS